MTNLSQKFSPKKSQTRPKLARFEKSLIELLKLAQRSSITLETFFDHFGGQGKIFLLLALSLAFGEIPGIALGSGCLIAYVGFRMTFFNNKIWLPKFLLNMKMPTVLFRGGVRRLIRLLKFMKRGTTPHFEWIVQHSNATKINGILIALVGISFLGAPLLPYCNYIAYLAIFFISIGSLNEDGLFTLFGYFFCLLYFSFVVIVNKYFSVIDLFKLLFN